MIKTETPTHDSVADRQAVFMTLYKRCFPRVAHYVAQRGGTLDEAEDVFQDALLVYYEKTQAIRVRLKREEGAYIFGIARYLWKRRYRESYRYTSLDELMAGYLEGEGNDWTPQSAEQQIIGQRIVRVLQAAGQQCMRLLTAFYYEKLDMTEVASRFGFSGARSATAQKFKCLQKVRELVKRKSLQYEDFLE